ncbi:MAG TPA: DUF4334 domain-containing protein [Enhygromyxa sp.]|nr:DUF4334 domain-containing protein [Enhygromyxa sp.]
MSAETRFRELADAEQVSVEGLFEYYDALPATSVPFMLGDWEGGVFRTGHEGETQLLAFRWVGKRFHHQDDVDPIVVRNQQGEREVSPLMGKASLRLVSHRGVVTATMVYDKHPIFDHFRQIKDDLVLGLMDRKGDAFPLFFWLRRL